MTKTHRLLNAAGDPENWIECTEEEWERAPEDERKMLMPGGLLHFHPVRVVLAKDAA